jgi:ATP-binding cassette subfamily B protein
LSPSATVDVLLDEAAAAFDAENERYFQRSIRQLAVTSTVLLIAHRLTNVVGQTRSLSSTTVRSLRPELTNPSSPPMARTQGLWQGTSNTQGWHLR